MGQSFKPKLNEKISGSDSESINLAFLILKIDNMINNNFSFLVPIFALFFALILNQQALAQCTETNLSQNLSNNANAHSSIGQSFTASCTGDIASITVVYNSLSTSTNDRVLNIRDEALPTSPIIHTQVIPFNSLVIGENVFTINASVSINASEINAWEITDSMASSDAADGVSWNNPGNYPLGNAWFSTTVLPTYDLTFAVQIDPSCTPALGTDVQTVCDSLVWIDGLTYFSNNNTAIFNLIGAAANSCDSIVTLNLVVTPLPDNNVTQTGSTLIADQAGATYIWLDCNDNNAIINGETNQSYTPTPITGNYAVEVALNGCVDTSACFLIDDHTGTSQLYQSSMSIYPNPASDVINISGIYDIVGFSHIEIVSSTGKIISKIKDNNEELNVSELPNGVYFLNIFYKQGKETIRFLKQ